MTTTLDLENAHLAHGAHTNPADGYCLMEAVSMFSKEPFSDRPTCVSPYLRSFGITLNDRASDQRRQDLIRFVPLVVGTAGDGLDEKRRWLAADHSIRVICPKWLDRAGMAAEAESLRGLATIVDRATFDTARPAVIKARNLAWQLRADRFAPLRAAVREAVTKALQEKKPVVAAAAAAAAEVAEAVAAAAAAAVEAAAVAAAEAAVAAAVAAAAVAAVAAAEAAVAAAAVAVEEAVEEAVEAAAAAAAAVAAVEAAVVDYWTIRDAVYKAVYAKVRAIYEERFADLVAESWQDALNLYERLITVSA